MTPSPTPAEVQAAYDRLQICINPTDVDTLLAAVARDTMGWREVDAWQFVDHKGPARSEPSGDKFRFWIKDAPT